MMAIHEINIWTQLVSAAAITNLYSTGAGRWATNTVYPWNTNIASIHHAQEGSGTTITDTGGSGVNGTIVGTSNWWGSGFISP
jgi:hypothetical protein